MAVSVLVPFPDGVQAVIIYSMAGIPPIRNRLWFQNRQPPTTGVQVQALADGLGAYWAGAVMPLLGSDITFGGVSAYQWDVPLAGAIGVHSASVAGGASSVSQSANVAVRVTFSWPLTFNLPLGSNFVPGIPRDGVNVNEIVGSFRTALRNAYVDIIDAAPGWGPFPAWRWVNASLQVGGSLRSSALVGAVELISIPSRYVSPRRMRTR